MPISFGVLLWARSGLEDDLSAYEDDVLALLSEHQGRVVSRLRLTEADGPTELQVIEFDSPESFESYLGDPRRTARSAERDRVILRTDLFKGVPR